MYLMHLQQTRISYLGGQSMNSFKVKYALNYCFCFLVVF